MLLDRFRLVSSFLTLASTEFGKEVFFVMRYRIPENRQKMLKRHNQQNH